MVDLNVSPPQGLETSYSEVTVHTVCVSLSVPRGKEKRNTWLGGLDLTDGFETKIIRASAKEISRVARDLALSTLKLTILFRYIQLNCTAIKIFFNAIH